MGGLWRGRDFVKHRATEGWLIKKPQKRHICGKRSLQKHILLQKHHFVSHTSECFGEEEEEEAMAEMSPVSPCAISAQAPAGKSLQQ